MRARDYSSSANPLVRYCHFGVSPVNYSDSDSNSGHVKTILFKEFIQSTARRLILGKPSFLKRKIYYSFKYKLTEMESRLAGGQAGFVVWFL